MTVRLFVNQIWRCLEKLPYVQPVQYIEYKNAIIILTPKSGTRSIRDFFLIKNGFEKKDKLAAWNFIKFSSRSNLEKKCKNKKVFIIIRSDLERIESVWRQKVSEKRTQRFFYHWNYMGLFYPNMSLHDYIENILGLPLWLWDKHWLPTFYKLEFLANTAQKVNLADVDNWLNSTFGSVQDCPIVANKAKGESQVELISESQKNRLRVLGGCFD